MSYHNLNRGFVLNIVGLSVSSLSSAILPPAASGCVQCVCTNLVLLLLVVFFFFYVPIFYPRIRSYSVVGTNIIISISTSSLWNFADNFFCLRIVSKSLYNAGQLIAYS